MSRENPEAFQPLAEVGTAKAGEERAGLEQVQAFLNRFGYLEVGSYATNKLDEETSTALAKYQEFNGLPVTGDLDEASLDQMTTGRCAFPDLNNGVEFATTCAWRRWSLTYAFDSGTIDTFGEFLAARNAFATWAAAVPLTFTEVGTNENPDVLIGWRPANDPDLDMTGGTLAHADFPPGCSVVTRGLPKPVHFDETEVTWSIGAVAGAFDIETVALHEIGHIIGLAHSSVSGAVMLPSVASGTTKRALTSDDISGAQRLYPAQSDWRWCSKCQGLAFGPGNAGSVCPAGGTHSASPSGNYFLRHDAPVIMEWQSDWRWCNKCQGLAFGPGNAGSVCPAGGTHSRSPSGDYSLLHNAGVAPGQQSEWRWCNKCQGLFFGGGAGSVCPVGGAHNKVGSGNYSLIHRD